METNKRQATIYWNPDKKRDKNTYNMVQQLTEHIREIDVTKEMPTQTQLLELLDRLDRNPEDLVDKDSTPYKAQYEEVEMDGQEWLKALQANPEMFFTPIVFLGDKGMIVDNPSRVLDLDPSHGFNSFQT